MSARIATYTALFCLGAREPLPFICFQF